MKEYNVSLSDEIKAAFPRKESLSVLGGVSLKRDEVITVELAAHELKYAKHQSYHGITVLNVEEVKKVEVKKKEPKGVK